MRKKFYKMHGIGNDYVYFNCLTKEISNPENLARKLSHRNFSIGGDGIILVCKSKVADAKMRIFNADGSEGKMCGNGIRCVAKLLYDLGKVNRKELTVETLSGIKRLWVYEGKDGKAQRVKVDMGKAEFSPAKIPVSLSGESVISRRAQIGREEYAVTCVGMGNPHCVVFEDAPEPFERVGRAFETSPLFPEGVNTEFVQLINETTLRVRVWERGSGETLACGTGACAATAAAVKNGYIKAGQDVTVQLKGGNLTVNYTEEKVFMTGDAALAYTGVVEI
ncbi:MAG: diaminopimelate epimerase [Clostridia bacterium]|nr:diaminopimelate epimerase [Clostridia bacterium]